MASTLHGDDLIPTFVKAHEAFTKAICEALMWAKEAGEVLLKLQSKTGLKGKPLFDHVRAQVRRNSSATAPCRTSATAHFTFTNVWPAAGTSYRSWRAMA